jgi:hypothetical protein
MPNFPDPLSRLPWFEDLRARAEHVAADALGLLAEFRATLDGLDRARNLTHTPADRRVPSAATANCQEPLTAVARRRFR